MNIIVIGGGIIGLCSAYRLARGGHSVLLLEKRHLGSGASGCSAAMLECQTHGYRGPDFLSLARASLAMFPELEAEIRDLTGLDFGLERCGLLNLALSEEEADFFRRNVRLERLAGHSADWIEPERLRSAYPTIDPEHCGGALFVEDGQVNGESFVAAMAAAFRRAGGRIVEGFDTLTLSLSHGRLDHVMAGTERYAADLFVFAAGAWTPALVAPFEVELAIEPVRGQLIFYETPPAATPFPVFAPRLGYVVPKKAGFTLVGTTVEKAGFDERTTETAKMDLILKGHRLMPGLSRAAIRGMSSGLRPATADGLPYISFIPGHDNAIVAAGHFRNGILLAPITGEIVAALAERRIPPVGLAAVGIEGGRCVAN